jgi:hypothetical protein
MQGYASVPTNVYSCIITLWVVSFVVGGFLNGFLFEPGDCMTTDFPFFVFFLHPGLLVLLARARRLINFAVSKKKCIVHR